MKENDHEFKFNEFNNFSPILITSYSQNAISLISSVERFLYALLIVLIGFAILIIIDMAAIKGYIKFLSEDKYDYILSIIAVVGISLIIFLLKKVLEIKKKLEMWSYTFEKNSLSSTIDIGLSKLDNTNLFYTLIENIKEIREPFRKYIKSSDNDIKEFLNQKISDDVSFDVLIDDNRIRDNPNNNYLKNKLKEYGIIVAKVGDSSHRIDTNEVKNFIDSVIRYAKISDRYVGLGLLVGTDVTNEALEYVRNYSNKRIGYLIVLEKPSNIMNQA